MKFLFKNCGFVEDHVRRLIEKYEGIGRCSDKTGSVLSGILRYLKTGQTIQWNYDQEYTFHLPKKVFVEHASTIQYFWSLLHLMSGNPEPYMHALLAVQKHAEALSQEE